jgi:hypothetical protein
MFRRLLAFLLIACLAAPALAASQHCAQTAQESASAPQAHHGHHQPQKSEQKQAGAVPHDCIGCIAPYSDGLGLGELTFLFGARPLPAIADQLSGFAIPPALPPPRA